VDFFKEVESHIDTNQMPSVKVCLASRPEPVLIVSLGERTGFGMQDYNASSISLHVSRRLGPILKTDANSNIVRLTGKFSKMAERIILWAILAVDGVVKQWAYGAKFTHGS
jgi:hypothetical protein